MCVCVCLLVCVCTCACVCVQARVHVLVRVCRLTTAGQQVRVCWMDDYGSDIVRVGLKRVHLLQSVVVEDTYHHVIRSSHNPALPHYKLRSSNCRD